MGKGGSGAKQGQRPGNIGDTITADANLDRVAANVPGAEHITGVGGAQSERTEGLPCKQTSAGDGVAIGVAERKKYLTISSEENVSACIGERAKCARSEACGAAENRVGITKDASFWN